jgi:hypothetical protein
MEKLNFKKEIEFKTGETYSVCLRGARRYSANDEFDLSLYTPEHWEKPKEIANVVNQCQYRFCDLISTDYKDNYDETARTYSGLTNAMVNVYADFDTREIVTILRFVIV